MRPRDGEAVEPPAEAPRRTGAARARRDLVRWTTVVPVLAAVLLAFLWGSKPSTVVLVIVGVVLAVAVLAAVHHAEVVAHRVGEPFGSLVLAVAVTVIEVGLIVTLMVTGGDETSTLARDTVFAAVMITCNGIVGVALLVAALRDHVAPFRPEGATASLATIATLATLTLVLPTFTTSTPGPRFSGTQLAFAAVASLALYLLFVFVQTVRHRDYFLPDEGDPEAPVTRPSLSRGVGRRVRMKMSSEVSRGRGGWNRYSSIGPCLPLVTMYSSPEGSPKRASASWGPRG